MGGANGTPIGILVNMRKLRPKPKRENPKAVLQAAKLAQHRERLKRAKAEDAMDAQWERECDRTTKRAAKESGLTGLDLLRHVSTTLPPHPPGWFERRTTCNRCGSAIERDEEHDAYCCRACRRWIEPRCGDPTCQFCRRRPARPLP